MNGPRETPPDEWWGDDEEPVEQEREPEERWPDEWDVQDWQDAGVDW